MRACAIALFDVCLLCSGSDRETLDINVKESSSQERQRLMAEVDERKRKILRDVEVCFVWLFQH